MKTSFISRFLGFSLAFYVGGVAAVFVLTIVKTAVFFPVHFWRWLIEWMGADVLPVALAELFRSPIMGLLFALLGTRCLAPSSTVKFGVACGAFSYAIAYFFSILGSTHGTLAQAVTNLNLTEYTVLGLPVGLVLLSRFFTTRIAQT